MDALDLPLRSAEFLAVDTETNGRGGEDCELTEIGAVLIGGGELHDRWESLVAVRRPLSRGIERFTGITQSMVDAAAAPEHVLPALGERLENRVMVAHSASFDRRVLAQAYERAGLAWPEPPVLCTVALARRLLPLQRRRRLAALADALGIEVQQAHRALADAETCGQVFCALFAKLCAQAVTVREAVELCRPRRRARASAAPRVRRPQGATRDAAVARAAERLDFGPLPVGPGVYLFRDAEGRVLYVGKSVSVRARARAHFAAGADPAAWHAQAAAVDHRSTNSELGALVLENRLIKRMTPPGNTALKRSDRLVYLRCRLDIAYPVLEIAREPAAGRAVSVGPLRGRAAAAELVEQLNSLFGLRHCGRALPRRVHPSAYGQMDRCLSPCLGDLDPNLYRRRLDAALEVFTGGAGGRRRLVAELERQMRAAAAEQRYERAAVLRRRAARVDALLERLGGVLRAVHSHPRLVLAPHPRSGAVDALWLIGGRVARWGALDEASPLDALDESTAEVLGAAAPPDPVLSAEQADELRIVSAWLDAHEDIPVLALDRRPTRARLARLLEHASRASTAAVAA